MLEVTKKDAGHGIKEDHFWDGYTAFSFQMDPHKLPIEKANSDDTIVLQPRGATSLYFRFSKPAQNVRENNIIFQES